MRRYLLPALLLLLPLLLVPAATAKKVYEVYPGRRLRVEPVDRVSAGKYLEAGFVGLSESSCPMFFMRRFERVRVRTRGVFEKVVVVREAEDEDDRGQRSVVNGEEVKGDVEEAEEVVALGPVRGVAFSYLGTTATTDARGILTDRRQLVLEAFDDLFQQELRIVFHSELAGGVELTLTRAQMRHATGVRFDFVGRSQPENLVLSAAWDRPIYRPGDTARLTVTLRNAGKDGDVLLLRGGRSISRWPWLAGRMFYFGRLAAGEERRFTRLFHIPESLNYPMYFLRLGFSEFNGTKPQLPVRLRVRAAK